MNNYKDIIIRPIITEKTMKYMDADQQGNVRGFRRVLTRCWLLRQSKASSVLMLKK